MLVWKLANSGDDIVGGQWPKIEQTEARCSWCERRWWSVGRRGTHAVHLVVERPVELRETKASLVFTISMIFVFTSILESDRVCLALEEMQNSHFNLHAKF